MPMTFPKRFRGRRDSLRCKRADRKVGDETPAQNLPMHVAADFQPYQQECVYGAHAICERRGATQAIERPVMGCAYWMREPGGYERRQWSLSVPCAICRLEPD